MAMIVAVSRAVHDQIVAEARKFPDREVCGLLFGTNTCIDGAQATVNVAADPGTRFEIDPIALIAAHRAQRTGGPAIVGHYHSHPRGEASPSARDAADAAIGGLWMIVADDRVALFEAVADGPLHGRFRRVPMRPV